MNDSQRWGSKRLTLLAGVMLCVACGPKPLPQASQFDTAANHYGMGLDRLEAGDLAAATDEFDRARQLDPKFPGGYVGEALLCMMQGDFDGARAQARKAIDRSDTFVDAHVALGRIVTQEGLARGRDTDDWLKEAMNSYGRAEDKGGSDSTIDFHRGMSYLKAFRLGQAREALSLVVARKRGSLVTRANKEIESIQRIERAAPGTDIGMRIALVPRIRRAELAVLLIEEFKLKEVIAKRRPATADVSFRDPGQTPSATAQLTASDTDGHWAQRWTEQILAIELPGLELFPDGTFLPDEEITRANFAMVNQSVLILVTGEHSLATRYLGERSRFADVRGDSYAYNSIATNVDRGIMSAERITGDFRPTDPVSGAEALLIIRDLQNALRLEF